MNSSIAGIFAKTVSGLILICGLFAGASNSLFAQCVSVSEIFAGYKANASLFQEARICYKLTAERRYDEYFYEGAYDYWSDGQDLLLRGGDLRGLGSVEKILSGQFPDNITSQDLETIYKEVVVISYDSKENLGYRWLANVHDSSRENNKKNEGEVTENVLPIRNDEELRHPPFLPLAFDDVENVFPTDAFFSLVESDTYFLGTKLIDGEEYYVIENRLMHPEGLYQSQEEGMDFCSIHRAWISIRKGCIPIRIENWLVQSKHGQLVDYTPSLQFSESCRSVFEVHEIQKYGVGFYPVRASHSIMGMSPKAIIQLQEILDGANSNDAAVDENSLADLVSSSEVYSKIKWDVTNILLDVAINRETVVLPFPKGTVIFDDRTDRIRLAGISEKEFESILHEQSRSFGIVPDSGMVFPDPDSKRESEEFIIPSQRGWGSPLFIIGVNLVVFGFILRYILLKGKQRKK